MASAASSSSVRASPSFARMDFAISPTELVIQRLNRAQNRIDVLLADVTTGETRTLLAEAAPSWVEVDDEVRWIEGGRQFLWMSERDGFRHIYLYDRSGELVRQVTRGSWEVTEIEGLDEDEEWVYFSAINPTPAERQLFRVNVNNARVQRISTEPGTHGINLAPDGSTYLDVYSRNGLPPVYRLHSGDGRLIRRDVAGRQDARAKLGDARTFLVLTSLDNVKFRRPKYSSGINGYA